MATIKKINGMYSNGFSEEQIKNILAIQDCKVVEPLKNGIYNFSGDIIQKSITEQKSCMQVVKEQGLAMQDYVGTLRDYQTVGVAFTFMSDRSMLGDWVGLGKTPQISGLINYCRKNGQCKRFIMAVENSAMVQTALELIRFTGLRILSIPTEKSKLEKILNNINWDNIDGIVVKHSMLNSDVFSSFLAVNLDNSGYCRIFDTFILDESSVIKNKGTKIYNYTQNICNICKRVHFLNATPVETSLEDIINQIRMLKNDFLPSQYQIEKDFYRVEYSKSWKKVNNVAQSFMKKEVMGYKNHEEFKRSVKLVYFGRSKDDAGIKNKNDYKVELIMPTVEQTLAIHSGDKYDKVLNCPIELNKVKIEFNRESVPKLNKLCEMITNEYNDKKVFVYCFYLKAQEIIKKELEKLGKKVVILNGETDSEDRYEIQSGFNRGDYDVILTNIKRSLNLYGGDVCIFYTVLTNPSAMFQAAGRIDRNVDNKTKTFVLLLYKYTPELNFFLNTVAYRSEESRKLTIDSKMIVDKFMESMEGK